MVLQNNLGVPAVAFFRGKFAGHALQPYPVVCDSATCDVAVPFADCSDDSPNTNNAEFTGVAPGPDNIRTFYFKIQAGESASFYLDSTISMFETETWVVPETFATVMAATVAKGPDRLSAFQMTNDMVSGTPRILFNVSYADGVSCAVSSEFSPVSDPSSTEPRGTTNIPDPNIILQGPPLQKVELSGSSDTTVQFFTIPSDRHTTPTNGGSSNTQLYDGLTSLALAECRGGDPAGMPMGDSNSGYAYSGDLATGMHLCRVWYYEHNGESAYDQNTLKPTAGNTRTYCNWLRANDADGPCWIRDGYWCTDVRCGYDATGMILDMPHIDIANPSTSVLAALDTWATDYGSISPDIGNASVSFSCGTGGLDAPGVSGLVGMDTGGGMYNSFWISTIGCSEIFSYVADVKWNQTIHGAGAKLKVTFTNLDWLNPPPLPPPPKPPQPPSANANPSLVNNTRRRRVLRVIVGIVAIVAAAIVIQLARRHIRSLWWMRWSPKATTSRLAPPTVAAGKVMPMPSKNVVVLLNRKGGDSNKVLIGKA